MTSRRVVLLPLAERDIEDGIQHYRREGGAPLAVRWARAMETALRCVGAHPAAGSSRYAAQLNLAGLRSLPVRRFPYLVFYLERAEQVDAWRVLHAQRDIPAWLQEEKQNRDN